MSPSRRRTLIVLCVAALVGGGAGVVIGLSEDENDPTPAEPVATSTTQEEPSIDEPGGGDEPGKGPEELPPEEDDPEGLEPGPSGPAPESSDEKQAADAARAYVEAINAKDGSRLCDAFVRGGLDNFRFPKDRGSCGANAQASIGTESKQLTWRSSEMTEAVSAEVDGSSARVVATVFTTYKGVPEPTIEDDIIFLRKSGGDWLVQKASATLYRAVGDADPPLSLLTP